MLCVWVHGCDLGRLSDGTIPNSLYRVPFFYLFLACALCYCSFLFVTFLFLCSRWSFVDVPLNFSCLGYNTASDAWIPTLIVVCIFTLLVIRVGKIIHCILIIGHELV